VHVGVERKKKTKREKAGIREKRMLVLWSGVCASAVAEMEKWRGSRWWLA